MKYLIIASVLLMCSKNSGSQPDTKAVHSADTTLTGFLFIDISGIYHNGGEVSILNSDGKHLLRIHNTKIFIDGSEYDIIKDEHLYRESIKTEVFYPEYGLFILSCYEEVDGYYNVKINKTKGLIKVDSNLIEFKNLEKYILGTYPIPTKINPLRQTASDDSDIVSNYSNHSFLPIEIKGDWVRVRDDKDCYSGEYPSELDIEGWMKWRENGSFILKVSHTC